MAQNEKPIAAADCCIRARKVSVQTGHVCVHSPHTSVASHLLIDKRPQCSGRGSRTATDRQTDRWTSSSVGWDL